jgi:peptidyl-prolyl cis-trans isomerase C
MLPLLLATLACTLPVLAQADHPGTAVRVNGVEISNERFDAFYEEYRRPYGINVAARGDYLERLTRLRREAMDLMIEQELIRQAAVKQGIEVSAEEIDAAMVEVRDPFKSPDDFRRRLQTEGFTEDSYRAYLGRMIAASKYLDGIRAGVPAVGDAELEAYYHDNEYRLTLPEQVRVRHILITWKPMGTLDDRLAVRSKMAPILERARQGEDFAALAGQYSEDAATAGNGGDTGFFHRGEMAPAFEEAAFTLQAGEVSDMVETSFGIHILRQEERKAARLLPLDEVREQLREYLSAEKMQAAVRQETERLRQAATIEVLIPLERSASN